MVSPSATQLSSVKCSNCPVRQLSLFQVIASDCLHDLDRRRTDRLKIAARRHLFEEGAPISQAYSVCDGWLLMYRSHSDGGRQGLRILLPGDFVGYIPPGGQSVLHSVIAVTDSVVCAFRQIDLDEMLEQHQGLAAQMVGLQSRYMASCQSAMLGLGRKSAEQRIAYLIAELYHRLKNRGQLQSGSTRLHFPITQEMLGDLTGLTPVHTNRVLRRLHADGVLTASRQDLDIHDLPRLLEIGEFEDTSVI